MVIATAISDTDRAIQHDPDQSWPNSVTVQLVWVLADGRHVYRTIDVSADRFFGRGEYGAPLEGVALTGMIENLRRMGPPAPVIPRKPRKNAKQKTRRR